MNRSTPKHIIVKMFNDEDKWLKAAGEKWLILYKRTLIGVTVDFLSETMEARRQSAGRENKSDTNLTFSKNYLSKMQDKQKLRIFYVIGLNLPKFC